VHRGRIRYPVPVDAAHLITIGARSVASLAPAILGLRDVTAERTDAQNAIQRGYFTPAEETCLRAWQARYLTARAELLRTIDELAPIATASVDQVDERDRLRAFAIAYAASCLLVTAARTMVEDLATHKIIQRKLNEAEPRLRLPRKQYTRIYRSLTDPRTAWRLAEAMRFAREHRDDLRSLATDPLLKPVIDTLNEAEPALEVRLDTYVKARLRYRLHSLRRRRATAVEKSFFSILEAFGRVIAEVRNPFHTDRITPAAREALTALLQPGDAIIARHDQALSNLFLPGYWPHAALHVGLPATREALGITVDDDISSRWVEPLRVLEARKDGVLLRAIDDTLANDAVAILRPTVAPEDAARAIGNALKHEGKLYNFDYDFFTADRLVCTEVVYRAFEGVGGIKFSLSQCAGRLTLTADALAHLAVKERGFTPIAVFGTPSIGDRLVTGPDAAAALAATASLM
jgi:hypothetical protein